ncbi:OLC1v1020202C1 [Oldenlandia corymbosa var. corymbosa]|uniref:OLC1v1020202C1 n=1 Tax=Oldenlandia corymbosa var. corymbosa TaxID=529605 RepID=A0AAV1EFZ8_OLDCO|nr:OLC1v1020202C1 [Oldenlandia corymbosa var. corymbosa]
MGTVISAFLHVCGWKVEKGRTLHGLVMKLGLLRQLSDARLLFNEMPERNVVSWNVILNGYAKAGFLDSARDLFDKIDDKDVVSWGTIIGGYLQFGRLTEALSLYLEMIRTGVGSNDVMIVDMISACAEASAFTEGQQFHAVTIKKAFDCYDFMQTTIIHYYAACEKISSACLQFKLGSKLHIANWNALVSVREAMVNQRLTRSPAYSGVV